MAPDAGRHLLDLDLEGIREAPLGLVVCCDRRAAAARGARAGPPSWTPTCGPAPAPSRTCGWRPGPRGWASGWVTLFEPGELAALVGAPGGRRDARLALRGLARRAPARPGPRAAGLVEAPAPRRPGRSGSAGRKGTPAPALPPPASAHAEPGRGGGRPRHAPIGILTAPGFTRRSGPGRRQGSGPRAPGRTVGPSSSPPPTTP